MELNENGLAHNDDYFWKMLVLDCPQADGPISAKVQVTQPQGFKQTLTTEDVHWSDGKAHVRILYPLIDEGRYDPSHGNWNGAWEMGEYHFSVLLRAGDDEIARDEMTLDPHGFFPSDRMIISIDAHPQIIECATRQLLYTDEPEAVFMIRIRRHRVTCCNVEVDVTARQNNQRLAGPWCFRLDNEWQQQTFPIDGLATGEYWLRIRVHNDGEPVGPYCIRKFWKQVSEETTPEVVELAGYPQVMVDDWAFEKADGVQFVPDTMEKKPDAPLISLTEPHEEEMIGLHSLAWNEQQQRYECVYRQSAGRVERQDTAEKREHLKMLLISEDGEHWEKPRLGLVDYDGSSENNILRDDRNNPSASEREERHDIEHAQFRFYDPETDGPVNIDNVFIASGKGYFPFQCNSLNLKEAKTAARAEAGAAKGLRGDGLGVMPTTESAATDPDTFRPRPGEHWPFEKRGDLYLVLTREALFYLGVGMDLRHTTESIRCHVEETDRKRLLYYFRPGAPAYPPHGAVYDNMHLCLRCLGVVWTDDGINYHRQFVLAPDAYDRIGSQFYDMGILQKFDTQGDAAGRPVLNKSRGKINQAFPKRSLYLGTTLLHWGIEQTQAPELIWTRDLLHFHRFTNRRRSLIENGTGGTYNHGQIRDSYKYYETNGEWWYYYCAVNTRHNGYSVMGRIQDMDDYRLSRPNHADAPYFDTWEGCMVDGKQTKYLPAIARCQPYRMAHAEPQDIRGTLTSRPIRVDGETLKLNAATQPGGFVMVQIENERGDPVLDEPFRFEGDDVAAPVADLTSIAGSTITLRFTIERARLYAFEIASH